MILANEGQPGAGKTYDAVRQIAEQLKKGRRVYSNIRGLNLEALEAYTGIPSAYLSGHVVELTDEQCQAIESIGIEKDAFVVIDEAHKFWPVGSKPLPKPLTEWVSEHRHHGLDVVVITQDVADLHNLWRRRIDRKTTFQKLDALGQAKKYKWTSYRGVKRANGIVWEPANSGVKAYRQEITDCYKSHQVGTGNKETLNDGRTNMLLSAPMLAIYVALPLLVLGGVNLVGSFFTIEAEEGEAIEKPQQEKQVKPKAKNPVLPSELNLERQALVLAPSTVDEGGFFAWADEVDAALEAWIEKPTGAFFMCSVAGELRGYRREYRCADLLQLGYTIGRVGRGLSVSDGTETRVIWPRGDAARASYSVRQYRVAGSPGARPAAGLPAAGALGR